MSMNGIIGTEAEKAGAESTTRVAKQVQAYRERQMSAATECESHMRTIGDLLQMICKRHEEVGIPFDHELYFKRLQEEYHLRKQGRHFHHKHI